MAEQQEPLFAYSHAHDANDAVNLSTSSPLSHEPSVMHFNTVAEASQGKRNQQSLLAAFLGLVGHEVQVTQTASVQS